MSNKVEKQHEQEDRKHEFIKQSNLLRSSWINFDQFRIIKNSEKNHLCNDNSQISSLPSNIVNFVI